MKQVVIRLAGKQYLVAAGETIQVNHLNQPDGEEFKVAEVLAVIDGDQTKVGQPTVKTEVTAKILGTKRTKKVMTIKFKSKKRYHRTRGHRDTMSQVQIVKIA